VDIDYDEKTVERVDYLNQSPTVKTLMAIKLSYMYDVYEL